MTFQTLLALPFKHWFDKNSSFLHSSFSNLPGNVEQVHVHSQKYAVNAFPKELHIVHFYFFRQVQGHFFLQNIFFNHNFLALYQSISGAFLENINSFHWNWSLHSFFQSWNLNKINFFGPKKCFFITLETCPITKITIGYQKVFVFWQ